MRGVISEKALAAKPETAVGGVSILVHKGPGGERKGITLMYRLLPPPRLHDSFTNPEALNRMDYGVFWIINCHWQGKRPGQLTQNC
jgi:hypothetical protein